MKPKTVKGTRDFNAEELNKRQYVTDILRKSFVNFGFEGLETPSFENIETLTGKYGEEGDRLIFKILNSGLNEQKKPEVLKDEFQQLLEKPGSSVHITNKALRYDLTVPLARYVSMNHGKLVLPFKRYQIQPVWRADSPQKGRYREFYQCDADVVGSESLLLDTEMLVLYASVFQQLKLPVLIHYNNRKILEGIAEYADVTDKLIDFTVTLDKLDKIGKQGVIQELRDKQFSGDNIERLNPLFENYTSLNEQLSVLENLLKDSKVGIEGLREVQQILYDAIEIGVPKDELKLDLTLARGLDYYTGSIYEVKAKNVEMGSIGGGGRYNNLTELFGVKDMPGIGISFGLDRILLVMEELGLFKELPKVTPELLFLNFSEKEAISAEKLMMKIRAQNIACEIYPSPAKLKKQFTYAEKKGIRNVVFYGEKEQQNGLINIKNIDSGEQRELSLQQLESLSQFLNNG